MVDFVSTYLLKKQINSSILIHMLRVIIYVAVASLSPIFISPSVLILDITQMTSSVMYHDTSTWQLFILFSPHFSLFFDYITQSNNQNANQFNPIFNAVLAGELKYFLFLSSSDFSKQSRSVAILNHGLRSISFSASLRCSK